MTTKFKVGDKVKQVKSSQFYYQSKEEIGKIIKIEHDWYRVQFNGIDNVYQDCHIELVEEKCEPCGRRIPSINIDMCDMGGATQIRLQDYVNKKTIMSKITTFAKNLVLSADEKLLRKYGLKDEYGEFTDEAESLVIAKLVKENEAYLVELATAMQVEEAKK